MCLLLLTSGISFAQNTCNNNFPNMITDICWSCMFPLTFAGQQIPLSGSAGQEDWDSGVNSSVCACTGQAKVGVPMSFWEPAIIISVHHMPGCLDTMGGVTLPLGGQMGGSKGANGGSSSSAFRQATYYTSPIMYLLRQVLDDNCSDRSPFNLAWTSEVDPSWNDDELANLKMPIAFAFGGMPAVLAGAADAIAANAGFPISSIFWQAGSWGAMYPLAGTSSQYVSDDQVGRLLATRMLAEAHDMSEIWNLFSAGAGQSYGVGAMCAQTPMQWPIQLVMDKRQYKMSRLYPLPQTSKVLGSCCSPIGRSTMLYEIGTMAPVPQSKDYGYMVFRKRDCCSGVVGN